MRTWFALGVAGMLGVFARYFVQQTVPRYGGFPLGTFLVNVSGALLIGFVASVVVHHVRAPLWVQEAVTVGFLGGFTTFLALALETDLLIDRGRCIMAAGYSVGTLLVGILAVFAGLRLGRWI